jgi:hypothetical protein
MTRREAVTKFEKYLAAYELRARRYGPSAKEAADIARAAGVAATQYIAHVDARLRTDLKEGA